MATENGAAVQSRFREPDLVPGAADRPANTVDLHTHSDRSDGVLPPEVLFADMRACGLEVVALSDHDTLAGFRALRAAAVHDGSAGGPVLIPAVEINSVADSELVRMGVQLEEGELHVLGYGVDADDATFEQRLEGQRGARKTRLLLIIETLRRLGKPIDEQIGPALASDEAVGRPHIARAMVAAGHVTSVQEAFDLWIDRNGPAYVPRQGMRSREAIEAILDAGGLAVLAHYPAAPEQPELIELLRGWGVRGIEVHYRRYLPETTERMVALAAELGLVATGGSDYHGDGMTYAESQATTHVPREVGERLLEAISGTGARTA